MEVVAGMTRLVRNDGHHGEILDDGILKFDLLFGWVRVVKAKDEGAIIFSMGKIIVEKGGLGVAQMKISP